VRRAALRGLTRPGADTSFVSDRLTDLLEDLDPRVRAEAACHAGAAGVEILAKMITSPHPREVVSALSLAPPSLLDHALERLRDPDPAVRAAAIGCAARLALEPPLPIEPLVELLDDPDEGVRSAAVQLAAGYEDERALQAIARRLDDPVAEVQAIAEMELSRLGEEGLAAVSQVLASDHERSVAAALRVVAGSGAPGASELLVNEMRRHVHAMWYFLIGYGRLPSSSETSVRFLKAAFRDAMLRERRLAFRTLDVLENPAIVGKVERELRIGTRRSRDYALEVLSNMGDREAARLLVLMHEGGSFVERARLVEAIVPVPGDVGDLLEESRRSELRWIRTGAMACAPREGEPPPEESEMERLLALKQVPLFENLGLEQLDALLRATEEVDYLDGELICREGERGDSLYLLLEGNVDIVKDHGTSRATRLNRMEAIDYFGEMASLVDTPRAATAVAVGRCSLLTLEATALKELILQMPEISFEIFRVLTARLKVAEERARKD
jgi:HEAT repeat protein